MGFTTQYSLKYLIEADGKQAKAEIKEVETLYGRLGKASAGIQSGAKSAASEVSNIVAALTGDRLSGAASQVTSLANAFGAIPGPVGLAVGAVASFGVAVVGVGGALFELTKKASEYGSVIHDASDKTGLHAETLSAMDLAAKQSGTTLDQVTTAVAKFTKNVSEGKDELKAFGITPKQAIADLDGSLAKVFKRISEAKPGYEQITLAQKAFGKSGADLLPFIKQFDGNLPGLIAKAKQLGLTLSDEDAKASDEFGDQLAELTHQAQTLGVAFSRDLMPVFTGAMRDMETWLGKNKDTIHDWGTYSANIIAGLIEYWKDLVHAVDKYAGYTFQGPSGEKYGLMTILGGSAMAIAERGSQARTDAAPPAWTGRNFQLNPLTNTLEAQPDNIPGPSKNFPDFSKAGKGAGANSNYSEMEKFFAAMGVTGTDRLSKHGIGEAVDVRTRDKTDDEVAAIIAKAIDHGYRIYDERLQKGQPHLHVETNTLKASTLYDNPALYGGAANLSALKALDAARRGKASGTNVLSTETKKQADDQKKADEETLAVLRDGLDKEIALKQSHYETMQLMLDKSVAEGVITEESANKAKEKLDLDFLNFKLGKLNEEAAQVEGNAKEESRVAQEQALLLETIEQTKAKNEAKRFAEEKKRNAERNKSWSDYVKLIEQANDDQAAANDKAAQDAYQTKLQGLIGSGQVSDSFGYLRDGIEKNFGGSKATAMLAGVDAVTQAFQGLGDAVGSAVEAFVLYGSAGQSVQQVTAQILGAIAKQAAVQAVYELAQGFAMLALSFFGFTAPAAAPSAAYHFASAAVFAGIAGGAALAGRAVAGNSFKGGAGAKGGGGPSQLGVGGKNGAYSYNGNPDQNQHPTPYSRISSDAYISGSRDHHVADLANQVHRLSTAVDGLHKKLDTARPGDVLTRGIEQKPGLIGHSYVKDVQRNSSIGTASLKASGVRR